MISSPDDDRELQAREEKEAELKRAVIEQLKNKSCSSDVSVAVVVGDVEIGPNNEIVKFLVGIGRFTKEMGVRIGREVNDKKLKEWFDDPTGSFERSDPGKAVNTIKNIITAPVDSYCAHNWCP